ncbi:hypothetical protein RhiirC2_790836, partial [Rhizophagus irregularis]
SLRYQTVELNSDEQIIQKAKIIDIERNDKEFKNAFVNARNVNISKVKLISLEKKVSLFLLLLFDKIYHNIGRTKNNNDKTFELPSFNNRIVDIRALPLAWSTSNLPSEDKICDAENCNITDLSLSNIILICGHSYHKECLNLLNEKYKYCFNYLSRSIKTNITSLNKRLSKPLRDDEISEITKDNDLDEDYEDENVETLLKQTEQNIDNQYEIQCNIWLNYNKLVITLGPFEEATSYLGGEKYITHSIINPIIKQIKNLLHLSLTNSSSSSTSTSPISPISPVTAFNTSDIYQEIENAAGVFVKIEEVEILENDDIENNNNQRKNDKIDLDKPLETKDF